MARRCVRLAGRGGWGLAAPARQLGARHRRGLKKSQTQLLVVRPSTGFTTSGSVPSACPVCHRTAGGTRRFLACHSRGHALVRADRPMSTGLVSPDHPRYRAEKRRMRADTRRRTWSTSRTGPTPRSRRSPTRSGFSRVSVSCLQRFPACSGRVPRRRRRLVRRSVGWSSSGDGSSGWVSVGTVPEMVAQSGSMWMTMRGRCCSAMSSRQGRT